MAKNHREGFAALYESVDKLTEKTYGTAARNNVELAKAKEKLEDSTKSLNELELQHKALTAKAAAVHQTLKKETHATKQVVSDVKAMEDVVSKVKAEIITKLQQRKDAIAKQVTSIESSNRLGNKNRVLEDAVETLKSSKGEMKAVMNKTATLGRELGDKKKTWDEETMPSFERQMMASKAKKEVLMKQAQDVKSQVEACNVAGLKEQLSEAKALLKVKEAASTNLGKAVETKEASFNDHTRMLLQAKDRLEEVLKEEEAVNYQLVEMNRRKDEYTEQFESLEASKEDLISAVATQKCQETELNTVKEAIHGKNTVLFDLECSVAQLQETMADAAKIKEGNGAQHAELAAASARHDARENGLDKKMASIHDHIGNLRMDNSQLTVINPGLKAKVRGRREEVAVKKRKNEAAKAEISNLKETLTHIDKMVAVNKAALDEQAKTVSEYGAVEAEVKELEAKLTEQKSSFANFEENMNLMTHEMKDQSTIILTNLEAEANQLATKNAGLTAKVDKLKAKIAQVPRDFESRLQTLAQIEQAEMAKLQT